MKIELWTAKGSDNSQVHYAALVVGKNPMNNLSLGQIEENDLLEILGQYHYGVYCGGRQNVFAITGKGAEKARSLFPKLAMIA